MSAMIEVTLEMIEPGMTIQYGEAYLRGDEYVPVYVQGRVSSVQDMFNGGILVRFEGQAQITVRATGEIFERRHPITCEHLTPHQTVLALVASVDDEAGFVETEHQPEEIVQARDLMPGDEVRLTSRSKIRSGTVDEVVPYRPAGARFESLKIRMVEACGEPVTEYVVRAGSQVIRMVDRPIQVG